MSVDRNGTVQIFFFSIVLVSLSIDSYSSMEGGELFNRIQERSRNPYTERDAARFISMIVQAVAHLHAMDMVRFSNTCFYFL